MGVILNPAPESHQYLGKQFGRLSLVVSGCCRRPDVVAVLVVQLVVGVIVVMVVVVFFRASTLA